MGTDAPLQLLVAAATVDDAILDAAGNDPARQSGEDQRENCGVGGCQGGEWHCGSSFARSRRATAPRPLSASACHAKFARDQETERRRNRRQTYAPHNINNADNRRPTLERRKICEVVGA